MSDANVAICRELFERWNGDGGLAVALELLAPDVEFVFSPNDAAVLTEPSITGREALRSFMEEFLRDWAELRFEVEDYVDAGERVVVLLRAIGRGRASSVEVPTLPFAYVATLRDGLIVRMQDFTDPEEARRSVGLPARGG